MDKNFNTLSDNRPIGVFDSGIGGLTVLRELVKKFPYENFIYLGDTARLPYGSKSAGTVRRYSEQNMKFLISRNVKSIVVACNTASTQIFETHFENIPVYNVIDPGAELAVMMTKNKNIAVLGTRATVKANNYEIKIKKINSGLNVVSLACPLFVPLAEEGWHEDPITEQICEKYLSVLKNKNIDTIVLGCTHYPLLKKSIEKVLLKISTLKISLVDSGLALANILENDFKNEKNIPNKNTPNTEILICLTDFGPQFESLSMDLLSTYTAKKIKFETVAVI